MVSIRPASRRAWGSGSTRAAPGARPHPPARPAAAPRPPAPPAGSPPAAPPPPACPAPEVGERGGGEAPPPRAGPRGGGPRQHSLGWPPWRHAPWVLSPADASALAAI